MMDLSEKIAAIAREHSRKPAAPIEIIEIMAKTASDAYVTDGLDLNETLASKIASSTYDFTDEHVKRAVELTNNFTFAQLFKTATDKNITFPVADSSKIASLRTTGTSTKSVASSEFNPAFAPHLTSMKTASVIKTESERPTLDTMSKMDIRIRDEVKDLSTKLAGLQMLEERARGDFGEEIKIAMMSGTSLSEVAAALSQLGAPELLDYAVGVADRLSETESVKIAAPVETIYLNEEHPLVGSVKSWKGVIEDMSKTAVALRSRRQVLKQLTEALKVGNA